MKFCKKCHKRVITVVKNFRELENKCIRNDEGFVAVTQERSELTGIKNGHSALKSLLKKHKTRRLIFLFLFNNNLTLIIIKSHPSKDETNTELNSIITTIISIMKDLF